MALAPIPSLSAVLQLLSSGARPNGGKGPLQGPAVQALQPGARRSGRKSPAERLHARLKVARLQPDWSASKALRLLVETALLRELGESLLLDPAFGDLVERTSRAIEQDEGSAQLLEEAFGQMTALGEAGEIPPAG